MRKIVHLPFYRWGDGFHPTGGCGTPLYCISLNYMRVFHPMESRVDRLSKSWRYYPRIDNIAGLVSHERGIQRYPEISNVKSCKLHVALRKSWQMSSTVDWYFHPPVKPMENCYRPLGYAALCIVIPPSSRHKPHPHLPQWISTLTSFLRICKFRRMRQSWHEADKTDMKYSFSVGLPVGFIKYEMNSVR